MSATPADRLEPLALSDLLRCDLGELVEILELSERMLLASYADLVALRLRTQRLVELHLDRLQCDGGPPR